jgi:hypothetical protein
MDSKKKAIIIAVGGAVVAAGVIGGLAYYFLKTGKCFNRDCNWGIVKDKATECSADGTDCISGGVIAESAASCAAFGGKYYGDPTLDWGNCEITWGKKGAISPAGRRAKDGKGLVNGFLAYGNIINTQRSACDAMGGEYNPINGNLPAPTDVIPCHLAMYPASQQASMPSMRLGPKGTVDARFAAPTDDCKKMGGTPVSDGICGTRATIYNSF